jgi:hypothetical protein
MGIKRKMKIHKNIVCYFSSILCLIIGIPAQAIDKWEHNDWACFIEPFDLKPENRVNILGSLDAAWVLHVKEDGKKLINQKKLGIRTVQNIQNMRNFGFTDGTAMAIMIDTSFGFNKSTNGRKLEIKGEWHPATYYKGNTNGGFSYRCKPIELVRD